MPSQKSIIFCELSRDARQLIADYAESLRAAAPDIGAHGMNAEEFWSSGLFQSAIEKLRGVQSATTDIKRGFISDILNHMKEANAIDDWRFRGSGERHDYEITIGQRTCVIEAKGCLDGNNTNIFERPANADEFIIWSLCQNPGSDPRHNAWSGIHTRLSAEIIHRKQIVDGLIIWDMFCGQGRICPKLTLTPQRATELGKRVVPPPCIYLFPKTVPDPRNNPSPKTRDLDEVTFLERLHRSFKGEPSDIVGVKIEARMTGADVERRTICYREGTEIKQSRWTKLRRAK
ncbi:MAG: hypothetical protein ACREEM_09860 [Blastocatellia bacterium]